MSYCPNCGRQILDESLGCPVCNVRNNIDPTKKPVPTEQTDEYKEDNSFREEAKAEQAETVDSFTVEEADGKTHHFETNEETGDAEYKKKNTVDADAKIPTAIKVLVIVLIVAVGGLGAIAGCVVGGVSLSGGKGSPLGILIGVTLVFVAENAIIFLGMPSTMRVAIQGALMAGAVLFDIFRQSRKVPA